MQLPNIIATSYRWLFLKSLPRVDCRMRDLMIWSSPQNVHSSSVLTEYTLNHVVWRRNTMRYCWTNFILLTRERKPGRPSEQIAPDEASVRTRSDVVRRRMWKSNWVNARIISIYQQLELKIAKITSDTVIGVVETVSARARRQHHYIREIIRKIYEL